MRYFAKLLIFSLLLVFVGLSSCSETQYFRKNYKEANELLYSNKDTEKVPFLKAHMKNGDVYIFEDKWTIDTLNNVISGDGVQYDSYRREVYSGEVHIPLDSVALYETNQEFVEGYGGIVAVSILGGLNVAMGVYCLINPKACYGSCPTFYLNENDGIHYSNAEGFTNAVSPSLEYADIDALDNLYIPKGEFKISMKNEALETHCVNEVKILAYPIGESERVYHSKDDMFYLSDKTHSLEKARAVEGDVTALLKYADKEERFSLADEENLNSKEEIYLSFRKVDLTSELGLVIDFRQTLMTTYLYYSALDYMGYYRGDIAADVVRDPTLFEENSGIIDVLGGIEIYYQSPTSGEWICQGEVDETGPIAINKQIIPLNLEKTELSELNLKLILNKGYWRIDYVGLANIVKQVQPVELLPVRVEDYGKEDKKALAQLTTSDERLISFPGSNWSLYFDFPQGGHYDLFLYCKGYYIEWGREEWSQETDLWKLRQMFKRPKRYLKSEAALYKEYEKTMEEQFWNSKIETKLFTEHEN